MTSRNPTKPWKIASYRSTTRPFTITTFHVVAKHHFCSYLIVKIMSHRIHGAAIYGAPWIPSIYPLYVSIYTIQYMDPMGVKSPFIYIYLPPLFMLSCEHISPSGDPSPSIPQKHGDQSAGGDGREVGKELHRSEDHPGGRVSPVLDWDDSDWGSVAKWRICRLSFHRFHSGYKQICWNMPICIYKCV